MRPGHLSETLEAVKQLVAAGEVRISEHGYDELASDGIYARDILTGVDKAALRTIPPSPRFVPCLYYNLIAMRGPFMLYGEFRKGTPPRR